MTTTYIVAPGRVYTPAELASGTCPPRGTRGTSHDGREYVLVEVAGTQVTAGLMGTIGSAAGPYVFTIIAAGTGPNTVYNRVGLCVSSVTASASHFIWAQIYGACSVIASLSSLPFVMLRPAITNAGTVDDGITSLSSVFDGLYLTATSGLQDTLVAAMLNYPMLTRQSIA